MLQSKRVCLGLSVLGVVMGVAACETSAPGGNAPGGNTGGAGQGGAPTSSGSSSDVGGGSQVTGSTSSSGSSSSGSSCTPSCGGKQCGDDGCGSSCGACAEGSACAANNQCEPEECPLSGDGFMRTYPDTWAEGQCIVTWQCDNCGDENLSVVRAHYHQPGNVLYAKRHKMNGEEVFSSGGFLTNLGVERKESIRFCEEAPVGSDCVRVPIPDCAPYAAKPSCSILFHWSFNGAAIRLRRTGTKLWAENQDPNNPSSWGFTSAGWLDASGGLGVQDAGYFCFEETQPAGIPEACP